MLRQAAGFAPVSPRFLLLQIKMAMLKQKNKVALRWLDRLITSCPDYRMLILDELEECYFDSLTEMQFLEKIYEIARESQSSALTVVAIAERVARLAGRQAAAALLIEQKPRFSSILLNMKIIALDGIGESHTDNPVDSTQGVVGELMAQLMKKSTEYRCHQCGFIAKQLHWRCPGCGEWQSLQFQETN